MDLLERLNRLENRLEKLETTQEWHSGRINLVDDLLMRINEKLDKLDEIWKRLEKLEEWKKETQVVGFGDDTAFKERSHTKEYKGWDDWVLRKKGYD